MIGVCTTAFKIHQIGSDPKSPHECPTWLAIDMPWARKPETPHFNLDQIGAQLSPMRLTVAKLMMFQVLDLTDIVKVRDILRRYSCLRMAQSKALG
jgi:hypothetical protein